MARHFRTHISARLLWVFLAWSLIIAWQLGSVSAKDYFITVGGGYSPEGNQASMEANVLFFDDVLQQTHPSGNYAHKIFFADGSDPAPDVQYSVSLPYTDLLPAELATILGWKFAPIEYRDHRIVQAIGRNHPEDIKSGFNQSIEELQSGDRLFIYVTAHGGASKEENPYNTKIYGWDRQSIAASTVSQWLENVPEQVPVIMVMAQCYCGGFAHTIFQDASKDKGLATGLRIGFYAQQHDLPAAGCRPDISNDEEYSSYFWGAIFGRTRNGNRIEGVDRNQDGQVSLTEAHIYAVTASPTIDIPLRASDALLRAYSHLGDAAHRLTEASVENVAEGGSPQEVQDISKSTLQAFTTMDHSIDSLLQDAESTHREIAQYFIERLEVDPSSPASSVSGMIHSNRRDGFSRRRQGRGAEKIHRDLAGKIKSQLLEQWPELSKVQTPEDIDSLQIPLGSICETVTQWPDFAAFSDLEKERAESRKLANDNELKRVQYSRLLHTLESIVLEKNLSQVADEPIVQRYRDMIALEQTTL